MAEKIPYAGENTIKAMMDTIKGDASKITGAVSVTFQEVYENLETLNASKEDKIIRITKEQKAAMTEEEFNAGNYLVVDESNELDQETIDAIASQVNIPVMTGATSTENGATGTVPAPSAGDDTKALFGDGTYKTVDADSPSSQEINSFTDDIDNIFAS